MTRHRSLENRGLPRKRVTSSRFHGAPCSPGYFEEGIWTTRQSDAQRAVRAVRYLPTGDRYLATSMGLKGRTEDSSVQDVVRQFEDVIPGSAVRLGGVAHAVERANEMIARGYRALVVGFDWSLLQRGIATAIGGMRRG